MIKKNNLFDLMCNFVSINEISLRKNNDFMESLYLHTNKENFLYEVYFVS